MKIANYLLIIITLTQVLISCKKNNNDTPPDYDQGVGRCRIKSYSTAYEPGGNLYTVYITYNEAGKLVRAGTLSSSGIVDSYYYSGNRIVINHSDSINAYPRRYSDTIMVDDAYRIQSITYTNGGTITGRFIYHYGTDSYLRTREDISYNSGSRTLNYYTWQNGDLIKDSTRYGEAIYDYDLNKKSQIAEYIDNYFSTAGSGVKSVHLSTGYKYLQIGALDYSIYKTSYNFDGEGRIISDTLTANTVRKTYEYECR